MKVKRVVFLYSEMAGYFLSAVSELVKQGAEVLVVHWPVKDEAPFDFKVGTGIELLNKSAIDFQELESRIAKFSPELIVTSGWMDKDYLKITKKYYSTIPTVMALDNHWFGSLKQRILTLASPFWLKRIFSDVWVAGEPQAKYAMKLGFKSDCIHRGYYTADVPTFEKHYFVNKEEKGKSFPKVFLYVGRYIEHKGIFDLWEAFVQLQKEKTNDWELWCVGTGELFDQRVEHDKIKHLGFLQPEEMTKVIPQTGVLVLPSHFEPWGVVVHEFAAAGYPMLLSDSIGSGTQFLEEGKNGYSFKSNNAEDLKKAMQRIINTNDISLLEMGEKSHTKSLELTPQIWAKTLLKIRKK